MSNDPYKHTHYRCTTCLRAGCKLWRRYQTIASCTPLLCCACTEQQQQQRKFNEAESDTIGWFVPAVPDTIPCDDWKLKDGTGWWGYTSVPQPMVDWWKQLLL